jgi:hypothetical protein
MGRHTSHISLVVSYDDSMTQSQLEGRIVGLLGAVDVGVQSFLYQPMRTPREQELALRESVLRPVEPVPVG